MEPRLAELRTRSWELCPRIPALVSVSKIESLEAVYKRLATYGYWEDALQLIEEFFPKETFIWRLEQ